MFSARSLIPRFSSRLPLLLALFLFPYRSACAQVQIPVFTPLGFSQGHTTSFASDVSSDGLTVVGSSSNVNNNDEAFRWTEASGMVGLGDLVGGSSYSRSQAVSADGSVAVGFGPPASNGNEGFRWTFAGGMVGLGDLPGGSTGSDANGVSENGSVVVGRSIGPYGEEAYRWTSATGMTGLGDLPGGEFNSEALDVSASGSVVVGYGSRANGIEAFRWTASGGMVGLGDLPGGEFRSIAYGVSANGSVAVGFSYSASGIEAFRWTASGGMVGLGDLPGGSFFSVATDVSADGSVVVGSGYSSVAEEAFWWTPQGGMVNLKQYLLDNFASSLPANFSAWTLTAATAVSADGTVIVGNGIDPNGNKQAWRVKLLPKWIPVDVTVNRTDNTSRLLWRQSNARYAVWKLSATGAVQVGKYYGPITGYVCSRIVVAPNGQTTLLWNNFQTNQAALWTLSADLATLVKATVYNYPEDYVPQNIAADQNSAIRMTLRREDDALVFWTINTASGAITGASGVYGPYANLKDSAISVGADNRIRLLWRNTQTGGVTLWTIPANYGAPLSGYNYNPVPGASVSDIAVGADNKTRLRWNYGGGKIAVWKINTTVGGSGAIESGKIYGPLAGVTPLGLSVGGDNQTRQLWRYSATGKAALWVLNDPLTTINAAYTYGPIP